jgi:hydrophobic/amphiphilic exporter-1 (mainly G- bacteria), HAE1 family
MVFGMAILVVFLILAAQYESWSDPFSVVLIVPLAVLGAVLALMARGMDNNIYTQVGLVLLVGLSAKNSILIVEFARDLRSQGKGVLEAASEAAKLRFRPILMTAFAFILGVFPLVVASGAGAVSRQSLGTAVCAGMLGVTILGVFFTPVLYVLMQNPIKRLRERVKPAVAEKSGE